MTMNCEHDNQYIGTVSDHEGTWQIHKCNKCGSCLKRSA